MASKIQINVKVSVQEKEILDRYCEQEDRRQSDVIREFIRDLNRKTRPNTRG